jgi:hypothetical protein
MTARKAFSFGATASLLLLALGCGQQDPPADKGPRLVSEERRPDIEARVRQAGELWSAGKKDDAIEMYSSIREFDPSNPYAMFGLGMQTSTQPPAASAAINPFGLSQALLTQYLASSADLGSGPEAERRALAKATLDGVRPKFDAFQEDEDGYELHEGLKRFRQAGRWGFADAAGRLVITPTFEFARNFGEGLAPVRANGKWGYVNKTGQWVIPPTFLDAKSFDRGVAQVRREEDRSGFYRFIDHAGRPAANPDYRPPSAGGDTDRPRSAPVRGTSEVGTFAGEEGGGSTITVSLTADRGFEVRQKADVITGRYQPMTLPSPEKANGNIYFDFQPIMANGKAEPLGSFVAFYSPTSDTLFLVEGQGARDRLLARGPHPEFALELKRSR